MSTSAIQVRRRRFTGTAAAQMISHPLVRLILSRLVSLVVVAFAAMLAVFLMVHFVPGNPIYTAFGGDISPTRYRQLEHLYYFDRSLPEQFLIYVHHVLQGNLGRSYVDQQPVTAIISQRWVTSASLAGTGLLLVLVIGVTWGIVMGAVTRDGRHPKIELAFMAVTTTVAAVPDYLSGTILVFIFAVGLHWLPVAGSGSLKTLILPAIAVASAPTMNLARIVRVQTLGVLQEDYIRTARSQRLPAWMIYGRHVLPNVLTYALTGGGLIFANVIGGAVIVETVFARPGLGSALVDGVLSNDYPVVQGITLLLCVLVVAVNTLIDISIAVIDPRSLTTEA
jgi:peptide/nickel transport system permease protein